MIEAVIFDVDGTLIDSVDQHAKAWLWAFARHGHDIPFEDIRAQIGKGGDQLMPVFLPPEEIDHIGETLADERSTLLQGRIPPAPPRLPDGPRAVRADQGRRQADRPGLVGQARRARTLRADRRDRRPGRALDLLGRRREVEAPPRHLPRRPGASWGTSTQPRPSSSATPPGTPIAAAKAGLKTIGLLCGGFAKDDLKAAGCVAIFTNPAELLLRYDESPLGTKAEG